MSDAAKIVKKPWGQEEWLELNDRYCFKRITIFAGSRTSLQYHMKKLETNYLESGEAELTLENQHGELCVTKIVQGSRATISPGKLHRIKALTDIVLMEVSTPEVDDVVRVEDDTKRPDGRIQAEHVT